KTELYAFVHDTLPPRILQITPMDSVTASVSFVTSLDPYQKLDSSAASVRKLPDSTVVPVVALILRDTTLGGGGGEPMLQRRRDTTAVPKPPDTLVAPRPPDSLFGRIRGAAGFGRPAM